MGGPFAGNSAHSFAVRLMQYLVVPTFVLDAERRVMVWNHACERLTAVPASEVIGTRNHWCGFYTQERHCLADIVALDRHDELAALYAAHTEPSETGNGLRAENWCSMPRTGNRLYLAVDAGPIYDDSGKLIAVVETLRDMTELKQAHLALQNLASRDGLTGIANRRTFDIQLQREWLRAQRDGAPLSLILADIDYFKRYNDYYGHQQGDACLRQVADALAGAIYRPADLVARYGGEEFAAIMPDTDRHGAFEVAERLREAVSGLRLPHACSEVASHVTMSLGVATLVPTPGQQPDHLVAAADAALYAAKHAGRNRAIDAHARAGP
ncbi:MAG TPA: diguanylate cyclase [Rhodocyclaceae bacterium]|nr:diguanylate cyclase [Rhodocyclaceae bacterium]